jgi:hypothetical protein
MMRLSVKTMTFMLLFIGTAAIQAQDVYVYPNNNQSAETQKKDEFECYNWSKNQTGFDPMERPQATTAPPQYQEPTASPRRGIVGGALTGAAIGEIANDDAGKGAAIGAVTGGLFGNARRNNQRRANEQNRSEWAQREAQNYELHRNEYNRAYSACLSGRGYTVR